MNLSLTEWLSVLGSIGSVGTVLLWWEARLQRRALQKPVLAPSRLAAPPNQPALFCKNFHYPRDDQFKENSLLYLGIKNVGPGLARNVFVEEVWSEEEKYYGSARSSTVQAAPGETTPLVIRFGYNSWDDVESKAYNILVHYFDIFNDSHYLQLQLWFNKLHGKKSAEACVINYCYSNRRIGTPPMPIFRWVESCGYFEVEEVGKTSRQRPKPTGNNDQAA